jgi:GNAT superfamily N-acetyltransferase
MIECREGTPSDVPVIVDFQLAMARETEELDLDREVCAGGVQAVFDDPSRGRYFLAESDGAVIASLMITYEWSDWRNGNLWWLQSVYVKAEFRRQGVFRALFNHLLHLARARKDVCGLRLYMHADNARARRSYEGLGMKRTPYEVFELEL